MTFELSPQVYCRCAIATSSLAVLKALVALDGLRAPGETAVTATRRTLAAMTGLGAPALKRACSALTAVRVRVDDRELCPVVDAVGDDYEFAGPWAAWTAQGRQPMDMGEFANLRTRAGVMFWLRAPIGSAGSHRVLVDEAALLVGDPGSLGPTSVHNKLVAPGAIDFNNASRSYGVTVTPRHAQDNGYLRWWIVEYQAVGARPVQHALDLEEPPVFDLARPGRDGQPAVFDLRQPVVQQPQAPFEMPVRQPLEPLPDIDLPKEDQAHIKADQKRRGVFDWEAWGRREQMHIDNGDDNVD